MTTQIDPVEAEQRLKRVFQLSAEFHEDLYAELRHEHPDDTTDQLFERYVWILAHRRRGKHGMPWELEVQLTKKFLEEWKRRR